MNAPCKDCPDRDYPHCHMVCPRYKEYQADRERIRAIKAEKATVSEVRNERFNKMEHDRIMKRKRRGK